MDPCLVASTRSRDFSSLYNAENGDGFNTYFGENMLQHEQLLEDNMHGPLYIENKSLNSPIIRNEV